VVIEIEAAGGTAVADRSNCATWEGAQTILDAALTSFGRADILVNSAGILRDRMSFNMTSDDWAAVLAVHLTGTFAPSRALAAHWRSLHKQGDFSGGRIINTTSEAGLLGTLGQVNYAAAKGGIATLTLTMARELAPYAITVNAISPRARTRLAAAANGEPTENRDDPLSAHNVAPLVGYLASDAAAGVSGQVFLIIGHKLELWKGWHRVAGTSTDTPWTVDDIAAAVEGHLASAGLQPEPLDIELP
jgi:NAD(P)-dependent dehydrogenase (short-subunit alcohol dehydrogenase family)